MLFQSNNYEKGKIMKNIFRNIFKYAQHISNMALSLFCLKLKWYTKMTIIFPDLHGLLYSNWTPESFSLMGSPASHQEEIASVFL